MRQSLLAKCQATSGIFVVTLLVFGLNACVSFESGSPQPKGASRAPLVWGISSHAKACVIFREYAKTTVGFAVIAAGMSQHAELQVIQSGPYRLAKPVWVEDQGSMNCEQASNIDHVFR
ncbi:MAG: hypothetical protein ACHQIL_09100 [Steroidobacterales bacterium]